MSVCLFDWFLCLLFCCIFPLINNIAEDCLNPRNNEVISWTAWKTTCYCKLPFWNTQYQQKALYIVLKGRRINHSPSIWYTYLEWHHAWSLCNPYHAPWWLKRGGGQCSIVYILFTSMKKKPFHNLLVVDSYQTLYSTTHKKRSLIRLIFYFFSRSL